jgi:predicted amidohydrolase
MPRRLKIGAARMAPNQDSTPREAIVERTLALLDAAARDGGELIAGPCIIDPQGQVLARATTRAHEPVTEKEPSR